MFYTLVLSRLDISVYPPQASDYYTGLELHNGVI